MTALPRRWHGRQDGEVEVLTPPDRWAPHVVRRGDELVMVVLIPEGHFDSVLEFPLDERLLGVLQSDRERYFLLFALLTVLFARRPGEERWDDRLTRFTPEALGDLYELVLFGPPAEVEAFATRTDRESRGVVSHRISTHTAADLATLRSGTWFGVGILDDRVGT